MITDAHLIGKWWNPPASHHDSTLCFLPNETGFLKTVSLNEEALDQFHWGLFENGAKIRILPFSTPIRNEFLRHSVFDIQFDNRLEISGRVAEAIKLRVWLDFAQINVGSELLDLPAGWSEAFFWRDISKGDT